MTTKKNVNSRNRNNHGRISPEKDPALTKPENPRAKRNDFPDTATILQMAKLVFENFHGSNPTGKSDDSASGLLDLRPGARLWHQEFYMTYIGADEKLGPRFELDYLFGLPAQVLIELLPYLRRSDYLNEQGLFTSTVTTPSSIQIIAQKETGRMILCDLAACCLGPNEEILVPIGEGRHMPILSSCAHSLPLLDDIAAPYPVADFKTAGLAPKYDDPAYRYYDHLARRTTTRGLEVPIYTAEDLALCPCR